MVTLVSVITLTIEKVGILLFLDEADTGKGWKNAKSSIVIEENRMSFFMIASRQRKGMIEMNCTILFNLMLVMYTISNKKSITHFFKRKYILIISFSNKFYPLLQPSPKVILNNWRSYCNQMYVEKLIESLPDNYSPADKELVLRAYRFAEDAHNGQKRASGEPYVSHCLSVAKILAELCVPPSVVAAGILHDTVEDTSITIDDINREFGDEIARLVDGVTKLTQLPRVSRGDQKYEDPLNDEQQRLIAERRGVINEDEEAQIIMRSRRHDLVSETLRKTFLAMGEDVRVVLIKLADRLHNMQTLGYIPESKQQRIAQETMDIFAPLANRLGIWQIKWELEDLAFRYVNAEEYHNIAENLTSRRSTREREMQAIKKKLQQVLGKAGIQAEISARPKHIYSIYKKMARKEVPFDMVHDIRGVRIIVPDIPSCYSTLGIIHTQWIPIPGEFDDYIAAPKDNFYRSLHTAVNYDDGRTLEIQIRTPEMDQNA